MMGNLKRKVWLGLTLATLMALLVSTLALADNTVADGDGLQPVKNNDLSLGTLCLGDSVTTNVPVAISRNGNYPSTNVFTNGSSVGVSVLLVSGSGLSASISGADSIALPADWGSLDNNTMSAAVSSVVTFTPDAVGTFSGSVTYRGSGVSSKDGGSLNRDDVMQVTAEVISCSVPNTPPVVSVTGVTDGASYEIGSVPPAVCAVTDAEDGDSSFAAGLSEITGPLAAYGLGEQTASCSYTDEGGLSDSAGATYSIVDTTAPLITFVSRSPEANGNGWNNSDVTVTWSCSDAGSGVVAATVSQTLSAEGADQSVTGVCKDHAGNTASDTVGGIYIDKTAPTISAAITAGTPGSNGWYVSDVTVSFSCQDALSGIPAGACPADQLLSAEGWAVSSDPVTVTDAAGNVSAESNIITVKLDKTAPTIELSIDPNPVLLNGSATFTHIIADAVSGIASQSCGTIVTDSVGPKSVSCTATDYAGHETTASLNYNVVYASGGMCLGSPGHAILQPVNVDGSSVFKQKSTVPAKFRVCDANGASIGTPGVVTGFRLVKIANGTGSDVDEPVDSTTPDTAFRWSADGQQWIFNINTKNLAAGKTYFYVITLNDLSTIGFQFGLK